ncbi:MAG: hypothetical protein ACR2QH_02750, partial [Geminicoccaceae bacterium]
MHRVGFPRDNAYETDLDRNDANCSPLTPISFLERTASVFPKREAWIHGSETATYQQFRERCHRFA